MANCVACRVRNHAEHESAVYISNTLDAPFTIAGEKLECLDQFTYIRSVISRVESAQKDIKNRHSEAKNAFASISMYKHSSTYAPNHFFKFIGVIGQQYTNQTLSLQQYR